MKGFRPHQQVRHRPGFECTNIVAREVFADVGEAAEEHGDVARGDGHLLRRILGIAHLPAGFADEPLDVSGDRIRQAGIDSVLRNGTRAIGPGHGKRNDGGLPGVGGDVLFQVLIHGLAGGDVARHQRPESRVDKFLNRSRGAKALGEMDQPHAALS